MTTLQQPGHGNGSGYLRAPFLSRLHEWIATADHKKLGVMYVSTGLIFFLIGGLVLERGSLLSHGAILAREYGIPTVVAVDGATSRIEDGATIDLDGDRGEIRTIE